MDTASKSVLVLAFGSTLRGDDGVAWRIGEELEAHPIHGGVQVVFTELLLPEHALPLSGVDAAIFIDCSAVTEPGVVSMIALNAAQELPRIFTHHLDPSSLLRLTQDLYGRVPSRAFAVTVGGQSFELSGELIGRLSERVEAAIPVAIEALRRVLLDVEDAVRG
jgi:hydrogenase maturation protease